MARETAQQRKEREAVAEAMYLAQRKEQYPQLFRTAVKESLAENFELDDVCIETGRYTFNDRDSSERYHVYDSYDAETEYHLDDFVREVNWKRIKREEENARYAFRQATFAKLTSEERAALGV